MSEPGARDDLVARVVRRLDEREIRHRLIGASALATHGVARSTQDVDLLVSDPAALEASVWEGVAPDGFTVVIRRGDELDPLIGVVRVEEDLADDHDWDRSVGVDVILVRGAFAARMTESAGPVTRIGGVEVRAVDVVDLVLLKLYAGGPRDGWDISALLEVDRSDRAELLLAIDARLGQLPKRCARMWKRLRGGVV